MKLSQRILLPVCVGAAALAAPILAACMIGTPKRPRYFIYMANRTRHNLDCVGVYHGNQMAASKGFVLKGDCATFGVLTLPVPQAAVVTWREPNGTYHEPKVKLAGIVPPSPRDVNIWFIIEEDGSVTVECVRRDDDAGHGRLDNTLTKVRNIPGTKEDLLLGAAPVQGAVGRFVKPGGVGIAAADFGSLVGNLPVTTHPDGSQSATLPDGTAVTVHARKPDGGFDRHATGVIRARLPTGEEIEIRYKPDYPP